MGFRTPRHILAGHPSIQDVLHFSKEDTFNRDTHFLMVLMYTIILLQVSKTSAKGSIFSSCCVLESKFRSAQAKSSDPQPTDILKLESRTGMDIRTDMEFHTGSKILCGSHSKALYCWNENLRLQWRTELDSEVYSTPFHHYFPQARVACVCVCSTAGVLYLVNPRSGRVLCRKRLPGEVFSSPVCVGDSVILGCRDDHLYSMTLSSVDS